MSTPIDKIMNLIDKLPEADRATIAGAYYAKPDKELSSKVTKLKKVFDKLDQEEQNDFVKLIGARKFDTAMEWPSVEIEVVSEWDEEGEEPKENLVPNKE